MAIDLKTSIIEALNEAPSWVRLFSILGSLAIVGWLDTDSFFWGCITYFIFGIAFCWMLMVTNKVILSILTNGYNKKMFLTPWMILTLYFSGKFTVEINIFFKNENLIIALFLFIVIFTVLLMLIGLPVGMMFAYVDTNIVLEKMANDQRYLMLKQNEILEKQNEILVKLLENQKKAD